MQPKEFASKFVRTPRRNQRWVLLLLAAMALILFFSYRSIYMILTIQGDVEIASAARPKLLEETQALTPKTHVPLTYTVELKDVAVHLMSADGKNMAYAQFTLVLDCPSKQAVAKVEEARSSILNQIFDVANNYTLEQLSTAEGKADFKLDLVQQFSKSLGEMGPTDVLIEKWVMG